MKTARRQKSEVRGQTGSMMVRAQRQNPEGYNLPGFNCSGNVVFRHRQPENDREAVCIGCGCRDSHACVTALMLDDSITELSACFWIKVDYELGIGICSECPEKVEEFEDRIMKSRGQGPVAGVQAARRTA